MGNRRNYYLRRVCPSATCLVIDAQIPDVHHPSCPSAESRRHVTADVCTQCEVAALRGVDGAVLGRRGVRVVNESMVVQGIMLISGIYMIQPGIRGILSCGLLGHRVNVSRAPSRTIVVTYIDQGVSFFLRGSRCELD